MSDNHIDRETILDYVGMPKSARPFGDKEDNSVYDSGNTPPEHLPGITWDTAELQRDFTVLAFAAPLVQVQRKSDGVIGTLEFTHSPRVYFDFKEMS